MKKNIRKYNRSGYGICPVCGYKGLLEEHHIKGRKVRGWNQKWNIVWICANCHDNTHNGNLLIEKWIQSSTGRELLFYYK